MKLKILVLLPLVLKIDVTLQQKVNHVLVWIGKMIFIKTLWGYSIKSECMYKTTGYSMFSHGSEAHESRCKSGKFRFLGSHNYSISVNREGNEYTKTWVRP